MQRVPPDLSIRPTVVDDADDIARIYAQSAAHLRSVGVDTDFIFDARVYRRDGFGEHPAFSGIIALLGGEPAGYLIYNFGYDTDNAMRYLFVSDLAVSEAMRGRGIGTALMARAAEICRDAGGGELVWAVDEKNASAREFYDRLGATPVRGLQFMALGV